MIKIEDKLVRELADDIMIEITDQEVEKIRLTEEKMIRDFTKVTKIDTTGIEPLDYPFDIVNTFLRDDTEMTTISRSDMLANAPKHDDQYVIINKVVK